MGSYVFAGAAPWIAAGQGKQSYGLYRLDPDKGKWEQLIKGLPADVEVRYLTVQKGNPPTVYVGTQVGPYRSTDGGNTWSALKLPGKEQLVWSIHVHPKDPKTIYVGTQGTTIYRSRDGGETWKELTPKEPEGFCRMGFPTRVIRLALDPTNPNEIYAGLEVGGVLRSLDGGETWESCNGGLLDYAKNPRWKSKIGSDTDTEGMMDTHSLAVSAAKPGTLFLANRMGLFCSGDKGVHWDEMGIGRFSPLTYARDIKVSAHDPKTMFAALSIAAVSDAGSLYRTTDLGESWQRFDRDVSINSTLMIIAESAENKNRVYCAARRGQVFGTEDGGKSWREFVLPEGAQGVYALATV